MNGFVSLILTLLTATALGGLIGLEREIRLQHEDDETTQGKKSDFGGIRTYSMLGSIGFLAVKMSSFFHFSEWVFLSILALVMLFSLASHVFIIYTYKGFGITSELSLLASFLVGALVGLEQTYFAAAVSILFTVLLAIKSIVHQIAKKMDRKEMFAILKFLIISVVILPLLPMEWVDPFGFFDWRPQIIWLMVVFVAAIRFVGYFLSRVLGSSKSILLLGIIGGIVSSTAVTTDVAQESRGQKNSMFFFVPILLASGVMFFRIFLEVVVVGAKSPDFIQILSVPLLLMGIISLFLGGFVFFYLRRRSLKKTEPTSIKQPFEMMSALSFGVFFLAILIISEKAQVLFPNAGIFVTSAIAGIADTDAITLAMANMATGGKILPHTAAQVVLLAVMMNTLIKAGIVFFFGSRELFWRILTAVGIIMLLGWGAFFVAL